MIKMVRCEDALEDMQPEMHGSAEFVAFCFSSSNSSQSQTQYILVYFSSEEKFMYLVNYSIEQR